MNKLMTTQLGDAQLGRNEDSYLAHVAKGEMVVPPVLSGETKAMVNRDMMLSGLDPMQYTVGSGANSINPMTGKPEFLIKKAFKAAKGALSSAAKAVTKFAPDLAINYAMSGGNPYAAAGMTFGDMVGGDFGRAIGNIAGSYYNPATGGYVTPGFNPSGNASLVDGAVGSIVGDAGSALNIGADLLSSLNQSYNPYENYKPPSLQTEFQPVAIRTGLTATDYIPGTPTSPAQLRGQLAPSLQGLQLLGITGAQQLYPGYIQQLMSSQPAPISLDEDIGARQQEIYQQGLDVLRPEMTAQQIAARDRAFGTGRLGFQLSGEAMGAGAGTGLVNVEDYTQQLAQNRALAELNLAAREQARQEVTGAAERELVRAELEEANRRGYLQQLGGGAGELLQMGVGLDELERINMQAAADIYLRNRGIDAGLAQQAMMIPREPSLLETLGSSAIAAAAPGLIDRLIYGNRGKQNG